MRIVYFMGEKGERIPYWEPASNIWFPCSAYTASQAEETVREWKGAQNAIRSQG